MRNFTGNDKYKFGTWYPIDCAPKGDYPGGSQGELWILGKNKWGEQRVIRWCNEYPCHDDKACWMFAYEPTDYIDGIQEFYPVEWMPLPE